MCRSLDRYWKFGPEREPPYNFSRERRKRTVACRLEYRRWPEDDQAKSLFNRSLRASLPARLAAAVVSK